MRNHKKSIVNHDCNLLNYDEQLCTTHDYRVALIMANDLFSVHIEDKLDEINTSCNINHPSLKSNLNWTGNKIDLVELIYALHHQKVINGGNTDIKELTLHISKVFNIELDENVYRWYLDIKNRKKIRTKFLFGLAENLNNKIIEEENKNPS